MISAFFFDLQAVNGGASRPDGVPSYTARKVGVLGAGMMGAGIAYVCAKAGLEVVLKDVSIEAAEKGKAYSEKLLGKQLAKGRTTPAAGRRAAEPDHADRERGRPGRLRPGDRGGVRGPGAQAQGVRRDRLGGRAGRPAVLEHLDAADHRAGRGSGPAGRLRRHALLLTGGQDAAGRADRRQADLRRGAGQGVRRGAADPEDTDRRQRQPRILHLPGVRHPGDGGCRDGCRRHQPGDDRTGRDPDGLPGAAAGDAGRGHADATAEDPSGR